MNEMEPQQRQRSLQGSFYSREEAESRDAKDPLRTFRGEFIIPSRNDLQRRTLATDEG